MPSSGWPGRDWSDRVELLDRDQDAAHLRDRVDPEIRPRAVRGPSGRLDVEGEPAAVGDAETLVGRLGDDRRVGAPAREQGLGADARRLLVDDGGDDHVAAQSTPCALGAGARDRREARLHVVGAAAVEPSALDPGGQAAVRLEQPDRVQMAVEQQRPAAAAAPRDADHVRPSGSDLHDLDLQPRALEPLGEHAGDRGLAAAVRRERRVDGVDGDQLRRQLLQHQSRTASPDSAER